MRRAQESGPAATDGRAGGGNNEARLTLLRDTAVAAGASWAKNRRDALVREGRRAVGGWPGTLSEARGFAATFFSATLRSAPSLTRDELTWMARATYAHARRDWLASQA